MRAKPEVATPWGRWRQDNHEVHIDINLPAGTTGKEVHVSVTPHKLLIVAGGVTYVSGVLPYVIHPDDTLWSVEDRSLLHIELIKASPSLFRRDVWTCLVQPNQFSASPEEFDAMDQEMMLEGFKLSK